MSSFALSQYKVVKFETASPGAVLIQLYDGAIRFLKEGITAVEAGDTSRKAAALHRVHAIVSEFQATLDHNQAPELCAQLDGLYEYVLHQVTQGNLHCDPKPLRSSLKVLADLRDGWAQAVEHTK